MQKNLEYPPWDFRHTHTHTPHDMYSSKCYFMAVILVKVEEPKVLERSTDTENTLRTRNENHYLSLISFGKVHQMGNFNWGPVYVMTSFLLAYMKHYGKFSKI